MDNVSNNDVHENWPQNARIAHELEGCRAYRMAIDRARLRNETPIQTAEVLDELAKIYPFLKQEALTLREMGAYWRNAQGYSIGGK